MALTTAVAGLGLVTVLATAAAAAPSPPAPGVTPGASLGAGGTGVAMLYTASNGTVWTKAVGGGTPVQVSNGVLVSAPAPVYTGTALYVFGQGTDNGLWYSQYTGTSWTAWAPLGGVLTSKPGAVSPGSGNFTVFVRSGDGAVYQRAYTPAPGFGLWQMVGGQVLAGTGPTDAALANGHVYVGVVGTDNHVYLKIANQSTGFFSIGRRTTANPALTAIENGTALAVFARGTDDAGYYNYYTEAGGPAGFASMGGRLTSGVTAATATDGSTYTFGLGTDSQVYYRNATWSGSAPAFTGGWTKMTG